MNGENWFFLLLQEISQPHPRSAPRYSCLVDSEIMVCVLPENFITPITSIRYLRNVSKERERVLLLLASVGVAALNFPTSHALVYTKYKSLTNILFKAPWSRDRSLKIIDNDLWLEIFTFHSSSLISILQSDSFPIVGQARRPTASHPAFPIPARVQIPKGEQ